ncbi:hypothetical protein TNCV_3153991 [Trichonephila clavipes]|nr:hypothetical protein TNCV_3153991 [Trichonephila clavipes]
MISANTRVVLKYGRQTMAHGSFIFKNKVVVQGDLNLYGTVNGIDISEEVITLNGNHNITGKKSFQNGIVATDVNTIYLDEINIDQLYNQALTKSGDQEIAGTKTFIGGLITNNIILNGLLNGHNVKALADSIVRVDQPALITGKSSSYTNSSFLIMQLPRIT